MRGTSWTTHPTTRCTDDIEPLASKTTHNDEYQDPSARGLSGTRQPTSRRRSPMAGIRWGEASKPGPLGDRRFRGWTKTLAARMKCLRDRQPASSEGGSLLDPARLQPGGYVTLEGVSKPMMRTHPTSCGPPSHGVSCEGPDAVVGLSRGRPYRSLDPSVAYDLEDVEDGKYEDQDEARAPTSPDWDDSAPEEVEVIPTVDVEAPTPLASGRTRLRVPASLYHLFCGGVGGFLGAMASGFNLIGGCDTSERARLTFTNIAHAPTTERVEDVAWENVPPDVVLATPPTDGFSVGRSKGAELAAAHAFSAAVKGILASGTTVGIIETAWEATTAQSGGVYRRMVKQALKAGYSSFFRYASPHRLGGAEVRPRLFIFLVPTTAVERVGPPPLLTLSRGGVPTRTVRSCLTDTESREVVVVGPIRWRRAPRRVGAAVLLGHYGRGGKGDADLMDSVWSVDGAAPPTEDLSKVVYACDGQLIRLTPREFARVRGFHDSIDIGEGAGSRHARSCVRRSPSVSAVRAATAAAKDYVHLMQSATQADRETPTPRPGPTTPTKTEAAPQFGDGSPQWCTLPNCPTCDRANSTLARPGASSRTCADAFRTIAGAAYVHLLRREGGSYWELNGRAPSRERRESSTEHRANVGAGVGADVGADVEADVGTSVGADVGAGVRPTMLEPGEHADHARVCQKMSASWHGFRYIYDDLRGQPYRKVKRVPCVMRTLVFWRFPTAGYGAKFRRWARGAPAFRYHAWHEPTRDGNYASGDGETAANFIQSFVADGILIPVSEEKVKAMIASKQSAINPIATIPKATPGQHRFLVDCRRSGTNYMLARMPSHFPECLSAIHSVVPKGGYSWSSDFLDCFYSFPLAEEDSWLFVVEFMGLFFRYGQLAQGSKTSPHVCLGFGYLFIELFRASRECHRVVEQLPGTADFDASVPAVQFVDENGRIDAMALHMDDAIGGGRDWKEAFELMRDYHRYVGGMGMNPKWPKLVPPTQTGTDYGGFGIDSRGGALEIRLKRAAQQQLHAAALGALGAVRNPARSLARLAGLSERAFLLNRAFRAFLSRYYGYASRVNGEWEATLSMQTEERKDVRMIATVSGDDKCFARHAESDLHVQMGDASGFRAGGAVLYATGDVAAWTGPFPTHVIEKFGSNIKELRRVLMQMQRHVADEAAGRRSVAGSTIIDFTDNLFTANVLENGRAETAEASAIIRAIRRACFTLNVKLYVLHCAGTRLVANGIDGLSRKDIDGTGLDITDWAAALAPAAPSPAIMKATRAVFGDREPLTTPVPPGEIAGRRLVIFPRPWSAGYWAEAIKRACVIDTDTDVVLVIPRRGESLWKRSFRVFHEIGSVRAGEWGPWPREEHESLHFYWLPAYEPPPPQRDRYFFKHGSASVRQALLRQRERDPPTPIALASASMRQLFGQTAADQRTTRL